MKQVLEDIVGPLKNKLSRSPNSFKNTVLATLTGFIPLVGESALLLASRFGLPYTPAEQYLIRCFSLGALPFLTGAGGFLADSLIDKVKTEHAQLEQLKQRYHDRLDGLPQIVLESEIGADGNLKLVFINKTGTKLTGYTPQEVLGRNAVDFVAPEFAREVSQSLSEIILGQATERSKEFSAIAKDGRIINNLFGVSVPLYGDDGKVIGISTSVSDLGPLRKLDGELRDESRRLLQAQRISKTGSWELDLKTKKIRATQPAHEIYGLPFNREDPYLPLDYVHTLNLDGPIADKALNDLLTKGLPYNITIRIQRPDGAIRVVRSQAELEYVAGSPVKILGTIQDITEQVGLEVKLRELEAKKKVLTLAGGIAHDLNNKFTPILFYLEMIKELLGDIACSPDTPVNDLEARLVIQTLRRHVSPILNENLIPKLERLFEYTRKVPGALGGLDENRKQISENMVMAVQQVRDLVMYARGVNFEKVPVDVNASLKTAGDSFTALAKARGKTGLKLSVDYGGRLLPILASDSSIDQTVTNLLTNAIDAMPQNGSVSIKTRSVYVENSFETSLGERVMPGDYAVIEVRDSGIGIAPESFKKIFEPYHTSGKVKTDKSGSGLGLAVVKNLTDYLGGYIDLSSRPGDTAFTLYYPVTRQPLENTVLEVSRVIGDGRKILVVDDDPSCLRAVSNMLGAAGFEVHTADRGERSIEMTQQTDYALVLLDIKMPGLDGPNTLRRIQQFRPSQKTIFISGFAGDYTLDNLLAYGAKAVLDKPIMPDELLAQIGKHI